MNYLIYDEMHMETEFNVEISQEVLLAEFISLNMFKAGENKDTRKQPIFTTLPFGPEEYEDFWDYINIKMNKWLDFFNNEVFASGVPLPY